MIKKTLIISSLCSSLLLSSSLKLEENSIDKELTVYNKNIALIKETKNFEVINNDITKIQFPNVAQQIITDSVLLNFEKPVNILTEDYEYDLVSFNKLLEQKVGDSIFYKELISGNGNTLIQYINKKGKLLSVSPLLIETENGEIVVNINHKDIYFKEIGKDLILKPSLVWNVEKMNKGKNSLKLMYLTNGINWESNYVLNYNEETNKMDFNGKIKVTNNSGVKHENIKLKVVAGDVNVQTNKVKHRRYLEKSMMMDSVAFASVSENQAEEKTFGDYHLYTIPFKVDLKNNQTKQISMFNKYDINVEKVYEINADNIFYDYNKNNKFKNFISYLKFENKESNNLGIPLPMGKIRMYQTVNNQTEFIGEDNIKHTPKNEEIRLKVGNAFDLTLIEKTQMLKTLTNSSGLITQLSTKSYLFKNNSDKAKKMTLIINKYNTDIFKLQTNCNSNKVCSYVEKDNKYYFNIKLKPNTEFDLINEYSNQKYRK